MFSIAKPLVSDSAEFSGLSKNRLEHCLAQRYPLGCFVCGLTCKSQADCTSVLTPGLRGATSIVE